MPAIIGNNKTLQPNLTKKFGLVMNENTIIDTINTIHTLKNYLSPRIKIIFIDNLPYFFRDFKGKAMKNFQSEFNHQLNHNLEQTSDLELTTILERMIH